MYQFQRIVSDKVDELNAIIDDLRRQIADAPPTHFADIIALRATLAQRRRDLIRAQDKIRFALPRTSG